MAAPSRFVRKNFLSLSSRYTSVPRPSIYSFSTQILPTEGISHLRVDKKPQWQQIKKFSRSVRRAAAVQPAPQAEAYLASGAIEPGKTLVDVKKVVVIGSGGLTIGQAGEFDYSGRSPIGSRRRIVRPRASPRCTIVAYSR